MPINANLLERLQQNDPDLKELALNDKELKDEDVMKYHSFASFHLW